MAGSLVAGVYEQEVDRQSAHEILTERAAQQAEAQQATEVEEARRTEIEKAQKRSGSGRQSVMEAFFKSAARAVGSSIGRQITRGVLGSIMGGRH